jgi:acetyltransferase-like isoleucine patch superfamily enzyme
MKVGRILSILLAPLAYLVALYLIASRAFAYSRFANHARVLSYRLLGAQIESGVELRPGVLIKGCKRIRIGQNVFIAENTSIVAYDGSITIGADAQIADNVYISSRNHRFRSAEQTVLEQGYKGGDVTIGTDVWLAHGVLVLAGSHIATGTVISANKIAPRQTEEYSIHLSNSVEKRT